MSNVLQYTEHIKYDIQKEKERFFSDWSIYAESIHPDLKKLVKLLQHAISGGKMLRGTLVYLGYETATVTLHPDILKVATAYEIVHTSLLIHDDIIDNSPTRRGKLTIHNQLGNNNYGISQSICLGDMGFFLASKLISQTTFSNQKKNTILQLFSQMLLDTILGEMLDIELSLPQRKVSKTEILTMQKMKTANYTFVWPLIIGATLGGASKKAISSMKIFGESMGIAFQIQDDILGVFGSKKIGKSTVSDIVEGKNTLLIQYARQHASEQQKQLLREQYGNKNINKKNLHNIKQIFIETGALTHSKALSSQYIQKAQKVIPLITKNESLRETFFALTEYLRERSI